MSETKHDGKLSDQSHVRYVYGDRHISITEPSSDAVLSPREALSLLAWLTQEREKLEQLAKEQG